MADEQAKASDTNPATMERSEHKRFSENHFNRAQTLAAWLLATLVAINSAAGAAVLSALKGDQRGAAMWFASGVVLAVVSGILSWAEAHDRAGLHYVLSREKPSGKEGRLRDRCDKRAPLLAELAIGANVISLLLFVVGCLWAALAPES